MRVNEVPNVKLTTATTSISITPPSADIATEHTAQMHATAHHKDGSTEDVTSTAVWTSSTTSVITFDSPGLLTCNGAGSAQVSASFQSLTASTPVTCSAPQVVDVRFMTTPPTIWSTSPFQYQVMADYADGTSRDVTLGSNWITDPSIASTYSAGLVICNNPGATTISATYSGKSVQASFTCILHSITPKPGFIESSKTFDGPFASWINIKSAFGAKGDGVTDDSIAFQAALNSLAAHPAVLWIPHGTYVITRPLIITGLQNVTALGEDPIDTTILWRGPTGGTMLTLSGCAGFNIGRLTWNGNRTSGTALDVTWNDVSNYYPTRNYIHDSRIINTATGIRTGWAGETTVDRVHFDHNTQAGISLGDWNALNFNIVDSLFTDNAIGVTNIYGAGAFNVSNSIFERSTSADIEVGNTGPFSFRNNLSVDSKLFLQTGMTGAPANIIIQGNTISHPTSDPIETGTPGSLLILDNKFIGLGSDLHILNSFCASPLEFLSIGNTYSVPQPFSGYLGKYTSIDEAASPDDPSLIWSIPAEIYVPPLSNRAVFDLPAGSSNATIQNALNEAAAVGGLVHLSAGNYNISQTLEISPGARIAILGDGALTNLVAESDLQGPVLQSYGKAFQLEDIGLSGSTGSPLIELHVPDTPSTRILCDECALNGTSGPGLEVDGLDDADTEFKVGTLNADTDSLAADIHGGVARNNGLATLGAIGEFMVGSSDYQVNSGGHLLVEDGWHDSGQGPLQFVLSGDGRVTQEGGTVYTSANSPAMMLNNYKGSLSLIGTASNSYVSINSGSPSTVLVAGVLQTAGESPFVSYEPNANISAISNSSTPNNYVPSGLPDTDNSPGYLEHMMSMARTQILSPRTQTNLNSATVKMTRVLTNGFGIRIMDDTARDTTGKYSIGAVLEVGGASLQQSCGPEEIAMTGAWALRDGGDGFFGLLQGGAMLSEGIAKHQDGYGAVMVGSMTTARDRWLFERIGDGSFKVLNRATGDVLTQSPSGCAYFSKDNGTISQHWLIGSIR